MNKFVILIKDDNKFISDHLKIYFRNNGFGFWHWFPNSYLITDIQRRKTVKEIRDDLSIRFPRLDLVVIQFKGDSTPWAGKGKLNTFRWFHESWKEDSE